MTLVIVHFHLRPGGIRRVIELATPCLLRQLGGKINTVILAAGEPPDAKWENAFRRQLVGTSVSLFIAPAFKYLSEQKAPAAQIKRRLRTALKKLLAAATRQNSLVWAHNLGVGRNLLLARELAAVCAERSVPLVSHHHDWWFDNRWSRWPEMRRFGIRTLDGAARAIFPALSNVRHLTINRSDSIQLKRGLFEQAGWLPNLAEKGDVPSAARVRAAREWLRQELHRGNAGSRANSDSKQAPIWILPCRLLRRKNVAEALLLTRWLRPEACLVTTGGVSSAAEQFYFDALTAAARQHDWPLRLGILRGDETGKPSVPELLATSETVLLTSIQEGFGLPYLEAAAAGRPLIAREIPNIAPDLAQFGFRFPQSYDDILINPRLFDWAAEWERQEKMFRVWRCQLPLGLQNLAGWPAFLTAGQSPRAVAFSRLTLAAQLEVLAHSPDVSWKGCAPLNPFLSVWRRRAATGRLRRSPWPRAADKWLSGPAYARRFVRYAFALTKRRINPDVGSSIQRAFAGEKLRDQHLFPLLW